MLNCPPFISATAVGQPLGLGCVAATLSSGIANALTGWTCEDRGTIYIQGGSMVAFGAFRRVQ
jgi:hypothetical protein